MKKIILYLSTLLATATIGVSCSDVLDLDPSDRYSPSSIWANSDAVDKYVVGFYGIMKESTEIFDANGTKFTDAYTDIIKSSSWNQYNHPYNTALMQQSYYSSDDAGGFACWVGDGGCYNRIRRHNEFLRDAPNYIQSYGKQFVTARMAEVRFIRAYSYYRLIRVYGGVVLRTAVDGPDQNDKARATEAQSWDQVIADLRYAAENLPKTWGDATGRVTKSAAYGMLSRAALFAKKWDVSIAAADSCKVHGGTLSGDYASLFTSSSNPENLFTVNFLADQGTSISHRADAFFRPIGDSKTHNKASLYGALTPTSELVDSYEMKDGTAFSWTKHAADPYLNREPRFYASILYNGAQWEGRTIETYKGGADGIIAFAASGAAGSTTTGYYLRKYITENDHSWDTNRSWHFATLIRYGEVVLNRAEALAEADWGKNRVAALADLNAIRARVQLPARNASTKEEFMKFLRQERMVELAGEGFRFWDLRRWRLAEQVINGKSVHGVNVIKNEDGTFKYEQIDADAGMTRIFLERYYAFSIPIAERANNKLLGDNNLGW